MSLHNPYCFGIPLNGGDAFVGRQQILIDIFNDFLRAQWPIAISLFGAPNIGTTSILLSAANNEIQQRYFGKTFAEWNFVLLDLRSLPEVSQESLTSALLKSLGEAMGTELHQRSDPFSDVKQVADEIDKKGHKLVILIDEIDRMIELKHDYSFMDSIFYALLNRKGNNINIITASKRPLYELFIICQKRFGERVGSPTYVHFRPIMVGPFSSEDVDDLIIGVSKRSGLSLEREYRQLELLGGRFPHFLQIASFLAFEKKSVSDKLSQADWREIRRNFENRAYPYYIDLWESFNDFEKQAVIDVAITKSSFAIPPGSKAVAYEVSKEFNEDFALALAENGLLKTVEAERINEILGEVLVSGFKINEGISEWISSLLWRREKGLELFSESFKRFVVKKSLGFGSLGTKAMVPRIMMTLYLNLRKHFDKTIPRSEAEVQRAVQLILDAAGYDFNREGEQFVFSLKGWRANHVSTKGIAIEVKLCKSKSDVKRIVEEVSADIVPYRSRYVAVIVVIYDLGYIPDETRFRRDFEELDGVYILIRKH